MNSTVDSIDFPEAEEQNKTVPLENSAAQPSQKKNNQADESLGDLGITAEQFRILFDDLAQGIILCKVSFDSAGSPVDFITLAANPWFAEAFGVDRDQITLKNASDVAQLKGSFRNLMNIVGETAKTGKDAHGEIRLLEKGKWHQLYCYMPKEGYVIGFLMDLTERKKAEQQFTASQKNYRNLFETTRDGIMARDLKGRMINCNQAYADMLGYTRRELRDLSVQSLLPEKWHEQRERVVNKVLRTGRSIVFEREYRRKDGTVFPASVRTWRLTDGKGNATGIWSIVRDINELKAHQRNLEEQAQALEHLVEERSRQLKDSERLAAIGQTAAMVGHDLRNPLQTVIGELFLAKSDVDSLPDSEAKTSLTESIKILEDQAVYMDKIVSDLQAFVRPVKVVKHPVMLRAVVDDVLASVKVPSNIAVQTHLRRDLSINADDQLLKRVLINLVTNAVQAMPNGGQLTIKSQLQTSGAVVISVKDTGVGIPAKIRQQIFTPLFTTKPRGQGFGLAVCKRVIEAHGGTITFESEEGKGTKFTLQLPAA